MLHTSRRCPPGRHAAFVFLVHGAYIERAPLVFCTGAWQTCWGTCLCVLYAVQCPCVAGIGPPLRHKKGRFCPPNSRNFRAALLEIGKTTANLPRSKLPKGSLGRGFRTADKFFEPILRTWGDLIERAEGVVFGQFCRIGRNFLNSWSCALKICGMVLKTQYHTFVKYRWC